MALISIIIPVYNVEKFLNKCIESVINQSYQNLEIVLIDDGSTDNSGKICDHYARRDSRIKVIHNINRGVSAARNIGLGISRGEFVYFVDADDSIHHRAIEILYEKIEETHTDVAVCDYAYVDKEGKYIEEVENQCNSQQILSGRDFLYNVSVGIGGKNISPWNKLYKKEIFENVKFEIGKRYEDEFIFHKICEKCQSVVLIKDVLYFYTQREDSFMQSGISAVCVDAIEALILRSISLCSIKESRMQDACDYTINMISYNLIKYCNTLGFADKQLNLRIRKMKKTVYKFLPVLFLRKSINIKEKIVISILLLSPKVYGKIWGA